MRSEPRGRRSPLGLGPLETAIMGALWEADAWLMVRHIRDRMDPPVAYTTVATVTSILCDKGLIVRQLGDDDGSPGGGCWWYRAARPVSDHIGELIAALLDHSPTPEATLGYALTVRQAPAKAHPLPQGQRPGSAP